MVKIEEGKELIIHNVLSLRRKMFQYQIRDELTKIEKFITDNKLKRNGPIISATYSIQENGLMDVEFLVPLNKEYELPIEYSYKSIFKLVNAIYTRHHGHLANLQNTYDLMLECMSKGLNSL